VTKCFAFIDEFVKSQKVLLFVLVNGYQKYFSVFANDQKRLKYRFYGKIVNNYLGIQNFYKFFLLFPVDSYLWYRLYILLMYLDHARIRAKFGPKPVCAWCISIFRVSKFFNPKQGDQV